MMKPHICRATSATSRFLDRGWMTATASGPAAQAAIVTGAGIRKRLRSSGVAIAAPIAVAAPARIATRKAGDVRRRLVIGAASIGRGPNPDGAARRRPA